MPQTPQEREHEIGNTLLTVMTDQRVDADEMLTIVTNAFGSWLCAVAQENGRDKEFAHSLVCGAHKDLHNVVDNAWGNLKYHEPN